MTTTISGIPVDAEAPVTLHIENGRIVDVAPGGDPDIVIAPGLVDIHSHGGGGHEFGIGDTRAAAASHHRAGTTTIVASLVSAPLDDLASRVRTLRGHVAARTIAGIHLEGPFLSPSHCGAQDPAALVDPDIPGMERIVAQGNGTIRMVTLAPELPRATELVTALLRDGIVPAFGHTAAPASVMRDAIDTVNERGVTPLVTHLYNGMPPMHHRDPGPVMAALAAAASGRVYVELVADGVHLAPDTVRGTFALVGDAAVFVSDATAATGLGDGTYLLGNLAVEVRGRTSLLADGRSIAGSVSPLLDIVRASVDSGVARSDAFAAATHRPAEALGLADVGTLGIGAHADVITMTPGLDLLTVVRSGEQISP